MENKNTATAKELYRVIQVMFYAMTFGVVLFSAVLFFVSKIFEPVTKDGKAINTILIIVLFICVVLLTIAAILHKKKMAAISNDISLAEKLNGYRQALVIYLAFSEAMICISMISYVFTGTIHFIVIAGILWLNMFLKNPGKSKIFNELKLNSEEQLELN